MLGVQTVDQVKQSKNKKLVPNLNNKRNYILHYRNLKFYLEQGLQLKSIHRVLAFKQSPWLSEYIDFNTHRRSLAENEFEKNFFKLMNNSCFGKTMENLRQRRKIEIISSREVLRKRVAQPSFADFKIINEELILVERKKTSLKLNRPISTGFCVLDISKILMFDFHYNHIKKLYPGKISTLLFTDTDSLAYSIKTKDIYSDMMQHKHLYDFSGYPKNHPCFSDANKKVIGKFKDELNGVSMLEFVGLKAKMYSLKYKEGERSVESKRAKGVKKCVVKKKISHGDYKNCLFENNNIYRAAKSIRSYNHRIYTINQNKKALSSFDDKRYILDDGVSTLPHGHYKILN